MQTTILFAVLGACFLAFTTAQSFTLNDEHSVDLKTPRVVLEGIAADGDTLYVLRTTQIDTYQIDHKTDLPTYGRSVLLKADFGTPSDIAVDPYNIDTLYVIANKATTTSCLYKISIDNLAKQECIPLPFADAYGLKMHISFQRSKDQSHILIVSRSAAKVYVYEEDGTTLIQTIDLSTLVKYPKNPKHGKIYSVLDIVQVNEIMVVSYGRNNGKDKNEDFPAAGLCTLKLHQKHVDSKDYTGSCDKIAPTDPSINYPLNLGYDWFTKSILIADRGIDGQTGVKGGAVLTVGTDLETPKVVKSISGFFVNRFGFTPAHVYLGGSKTVKNLVKVGKTQQWQEWTEAVLKYYAVKWT